jgi:hypothetical protein
MSVIAAISVSFRPRVVGGQNFPQLPPKSLSMQKVRPHRHAALRRQPLVGERNPPGRSTVFGASWQARRLVRLPSRFGNLIWFHHRKPAKRCSLFQAESFRPSEKYRGSYLMQPVKRTFPGLRWRLAKDGGIPFRILHAYCVASR